MQATYQSVEDMLAQLRPSYPIYCFRPAEFERQARRFLEGFPGRVLYATKCNPHPSVLDTLYGAGILHFDTASLAEIALVSERFEDARCYFHHPVKSPAAISSAYLVFGVRDFTIDHGNELDKIIRETDGGRDVGVQVRMATAGGYATYNLSAKFGAPPEECVRLLRRVAAEGLTAGLSFHVGSQCTHPEAYGMALKTAGEVIAEAGVPISCLNVGGGFPAHYAGYEVPPIEDFLAEIRTVSAGLGLPDDTVLMCEPGRSMVAEGCTMVVQVHLRKDNQIYINDGVYGSLFEVRESGLSPPARAIRLDGPVANDTDAFTVFGPTCDCVDVLPNSMTLPADVREGDWIEIGQVGAYSNAVATKFNGFQAETFVAITEQPQRWAVA